MGYLPSKNRHTLTSTHLSRPPQTGRPNRQLPSQTGHPGKRPKGLLSSRRCFSWCSTSAWSAPSRRQPGVACCTPAKMLTARRSTLPEGINPRKAKLTAGYNLFCGFHPTRGRTQSHPQILCITSGVHKANKIISFCFIMIQIMILKWGQFPVGVNHECKTANRL